MRLDRNTNPDGTGKYALVNMRRLRQLSPDNQRVANDMLHSLAEMGVLTYGNETPADQFFVLKYKDPFAFAALLAYAEACRINAQFQIDNPKLGNAKKANEYLEYAAEIRKEAEISAACEHKLPD